jgi:hypothetical protein
MRMSAWPVMMAGSSDSGSAPLTMVRSARGSCRRQPHCQTQAATIKKKRAGRKIRQARLKDDIGNQ